MQNRFLREQQAVLEEFTSHRIGDAGFRRQCDYVLDNGDFLHYHRLIEMGYCTAGEGICRVNEEEYLYRVGDAQLVLPFQPHFSLSTGAQFSHWRWVFVDPCELSECARQAEESDYGRLLQSGIGLCGIFSARRHPEIAESIRQFIDASGVFGGDGTREIALLLLRVLLLRLARASEALPKYDIRLQWRDDNLSRLLGAISESVRQGAQPEVAALAARLGYSDSYFRAYFKRQVGVAPKTYILNIAIRDAQRMLIESDLSVEEISRRVGFRDVSGLYRSFLALRGISPSAYRKRWRKGAPDSP